MDLVHQYHASFKKKKKKHFNTDVKDLSCNSKPSDRGEKNLRNVFHTLLMFHRDFKAEWVMDGQRGRGGSMSKGGSGNPVGGSADRR